MNVKKTTVSFTQCSEDVIVPSHLLLEPSTNKKVIWFLVITGVIAWLILLSLDISRSGFLFSTLLVLGFVLLIFFVQKTMRRTWIEFNRKIGKVVIWRSLKKNKKIGEYTLEQIQFTVGETFMTDLGPTYYNITITTPHLLWRQRYVLLDFHNLRITNKDDKLIAEGLLLETVEFIKKFMSGAQIAPSESHEIKVTLMVCAAYLICFIQVACIITNSIC